MFSGIFSTSQRWGALHLPGCCSQFVTGRVAANAKCGKRHGSPSPASAQVPHNGLMVANIPARDTVSSMSRGHPRSSHMSTREQPMNSIRSEKISLTEDNLVAQIETGIRDSVRGDVADLRRPSSLPSTTDPALDPSTKPSVNNINSLIEHVAGGSLTE